MLVNDAGTTREGPTGVVLIEIEIGIGIGIEIETTPLTASGPGNA